MKYVDEANGLYSKLGKFTHGKSCLYIKKLSDINLDVFKELLIASTES